MVPPVHDEPKPFLDHLEDLRWMIIKSVITLALAMGLSCVFARELLYLLQWPLRRMAEVQGEQLETYLRTLQVMDAFSMVLQTGFVAGLVISLPFIFYFIAEFILPALHPRERRLLLPVFFFGGGLFLSGAFFCFILVLPNALGWMVDLNHWIGVRPEWTLQSYLGFTLQMLVAFGLSFELPLVMAVLAKLDIVTSTFFKTYRRHAVVVLLIFAACVTPTSDPYNLMLLFGPLYLLYEIGIWITLLIERRRESV
ncbi:MAG: twin-arginine translocase subunit TatC [Candidatus Methylacidiphilales bacterium]